MAERKAADTNLSNALIKVSGTTGEAMERTTHSRLVGQYHGMYALLSERKAMTLAIVLMSPATKYRAKGSPMLHLHRRTAGARRRAAEARQHTAEAGRDTAPAPKAAHPPALVRPQRV